MPTAVASSSSGHGDRRGFICLQQSELFEVVVELGVRDFLEITQCKNALYFKYRSEYAAY